MNLKISQLVAAAVVALIIADAGFSAVGSPTTPPSASQSGLTPNPNSRGINAGNDIVTGNVSGGREFRGFVPYGSSGYFSGARGMGSGTGAMESFIRRTTGTPYTADRSPGAVEPYYSPYRSVSSLASRGGSYKSSSALEIPQMSPIKKPSEFGLIPLEDARKLKQKYEPQRPQTIEPSEKEPLSLYGNYRPLSSTPLEKENYIAEQALERLYPSEQQAQAERKLSGLEKASAVEQKKFVFEPVQKPLEPGEPGALYSQVKPQAEKTPSVFEQMQKTASDDFQKTLKEMKTAPKSATDGNAPSDSNGTRASSISPVMAKAIVGYSTTFATKEKTRFNELMKAAEEYIKKNQYYKAADAYSLASIYQPDNPLPYAGKAHALFGAGEYMSSAYFLSRAIEIFPDYTRFKIDLGAMFGDKDLLEKRTADIAKWQERTNSPELQFLLAYIYFQTDRLEEAQRMLNGALYQMPRSQSLQTLDRVIRRAIEEAKDTGKP